MFLLYEYDIFWAFLIISSLIPILVFFIAKVIVFLGIITSQKYLLMPKIAITFVMEIRMILTPIYSLSMLCQMFYGYKLFNTPNSYVYYGSRELFVSISIFLPVRKSVDFQERKSYDMLGISYDNHPRLKRILMPESWIGWPLCKDYIAPNFYEIKIS